MYNAVHMYSIMLEVDIISRDMYGIWMVSDF